MPLDEMLQERYNNIMKKYKKKKKYRLAQQRQQNQRNGIKQSPQNQQKPRKISFGNVCAIVTILVTVAGMITSICINNQNLKKQEKFTLYLEEQAAIPHFRLSSDLNASVEMSIFPPNREPSAIPINENIFFMECYFSIRNFVLENKSNNFAYFNHIEYGGVAYELVNQNLFVEMNETVRFSNSNKFIGLNREPYLYLIVRSKYDKYYSYECTLRNESVDNNIYCLYVDNIGSPIEYDIHNEIYENRYIHVRDII